MVQRKTWLVVPLSLAFFAAYAIAAWAAASTNTGPDIRLTLQTQAGLAAHTTVTETISLAQIRPIFAAIDIETDSYILGDYILAGRTESVKLAVGSAGWIVAYHTRDYSVQRLFDCASFNGNEPGEMINLPERAVMQVVAALQTSDNGIQFYDFRFPAGDNILLHWLFLPNTGNRTSNINLPLTNSYLERGYVFCTALTSSKFWLNQEIIDQQGSLSQVIYRWGPLGADQLRAGQTNTLRIEAISLFGYGFIGGVSAVYNGTAPIDSSGGYTRLLPLAYPAALGDPLILSTQNLPLLRR